VAKYGCDSIRLEEDPIDCAPQNGPKRDWITLLGVIGALASIVGLPLAYLVIRKPRWRKYRCRGLPYERIFRRGDYGYDPQMFLKDVGSVGLALRELSTWYADGKPLLLRGVTGIGKSRLATEFIGGLGIWHRLRTRVLMPTPHEFNERFPPFLPARYVLFLNDLHEFRGSVPDDKLRFYAEDRRFKVVATIPSEKYDSDWSVLSGSIWRRVEVEKWETEEGRRLAEARKTVFRLDSFTGTPLSIIAPSAEIKRSYELLGCDRKAVLEALKIAKIHLGCFADYELLSRVPVGSGRFDESAFTDVIAKQRFWCKTDKSTAMLADGMEDFVDYEVSIEDAYKLEAVLMREEPTLRNREEYLFYLGNGFSRMGENQRALKCYDLSKELDPISPSPWLNRGNVLRVLGRIEDALDSYRQAKKLFEKLGDQSGTATTLHQLATIEQHKGNYDEAKMLYDQSLTIARKLGDQSGTATTLGALGRLAESQRDLEAAEKYYEQALEIFEKLGEKPHIDLARRHLEGVRKLKQKA
jgi:tetratricopeptide (TPR) repeat protein